MTDKQREEWIEEKARDIQRWFRNWRESHDELPLHTAKNMARILLDETPKPKVSRWFIKEWKEKLIFADLQKISVFEEFIVQMLKEAGVEVEE